MTTSPFAVRRLTAAFAAALLLPLASALPAEAATPTAPANLAPDSTEVSTNTPTLSWSKVSGGVKYEVQADDDPGFDTPNFTSTTVNNRAVPTKALPNGEISWRVRTFNASNVASSWSVGSFAVAPAAAPTPLSPVGDTVLAPAEPPLLTWSAVQGAASYTVEVDETSEFTTPVTSTSTQSTSLVVPVPLLDGQYFWRVKATKGAGTDTLFSEPATFNVSKLPAPVVVSPTSSVDFEIEDVVLDWQPVAGAEFYHLEVATDEDFNNLVSAAQTKVYGTRYSPAVTYDNNQYYWRVRAVDVAANPGPWGQGEFNRVWPDSPSPVYPLGTTGDPAVVTGDMYFEWTPVQHASQYELQLGTDPNFSPLTYAECQTTLTTFTPGYQNLGTHFGCPVVPGTTYYWRVRALDRPFLSPGLESIYSPTQTFRYDDGDFALLDPSAGEEVAVPTLRWSPSRGADHYDITIVDNTGAPQLSATTYSTSYTPVNKLLPAAKSPFTWSITAEDSANKPVTQTHHRTFTIAGSVPTSGQEPLTPLTGVPGDASTVRAPNLTWEPHPTADHYKVWAGVHGSNSFYSPVGGDALGKKLYYPAVTDTWKWFLSPGSYDWFVQAFTAQGVLIDEGPLGTFSIGQLEPVTGQQIALDGSTLDAGEACVKAVPAICENVPSTPVLDWAPVDGAGAYMIYLSEDRDFTNLVEPAVPITTNTRWAPTMSSAHSAFPDSDAGASYFWFIRPCKTLNTCGPSPVSVLDSATNKFRKKSPPVTGLATTGDAATDAADITFSWQDYRATNAATTWAETGEQSRQSAKSYKIQVDNDPNFSSPLDTATVDQTTYTAPGKLYPDGELYWRVQAIDGDDNPLSWSVATSATVLGRPFTKSTPPPAQQLPAAGAVVNGTVPFTWAATPSTSSYEIQVYKNNDETASIGNLLFAKTGLKQSAYVWEKPIPAAGVPYRWRIRRRDASGNVGPWSGLRSFTSAGSSPTLLAPAVGALQPAAGPLFSWGPVTGAATYVIEGRSSTSTATPFTPVTTAATAWATTAVVPNGSWQWRVTAKDAGGAVLGSSAWRGFTVDAIRPTVTTKSPTGTVSRTTNFKVTFSEPVLGVTTSTFQIVRSGTTTPLAAVVTVSADRRSAILNPGVTLRAGTKYTIKVKSGIKDGAGNTLVATSWTVTAS